MTREEQIRRGAINYIRFTDNTIKVTVGLSFTDGAKWADSNPDWHKYPEEKPELNQRILIYTATGRIVETVWHQPMLISGEPHGEPTFEDNRYTARNVIAWMEKPRHPKFD